MQGTAKILQKLVWMTLLAQPFFWNKEYCLFRENQIIYFNYIFTICPLLSPTPTNTTSDFIMSARFQVEGQQVGLILHLEQKKQGSGQETEIKCVQMYSLGYKGKGEGGITRNNSTFLNRGYTRVKEDEVKRIQCRPIGYKSV